MYRIAYAGIEGFHVLTRGEIGHSPAIEHESLDQAILEANWSHTSVYGGHYVVLDEHDKHVYSTQGKSRNWQDYSN